MGLLDSVKKALKGAVTAPAPSTAPEPVSPAAEQSGTAPEAPARTFTTYTIRTGDTLGDVGARHGVTREELARLNGIDEPDLIFPGQELRIPTS